MVVALPVREREIFIDQTLKSYMNNPSQILSLTWERITKQTFRTNPGMAFDFSYGNAISESTVEDVLEAVEELIDR